MGSRAGLDKYRKSCPTGFDPWTVHPKASHYTNYTVPTKELRSCHIYHVQSLNWLVLSLHVASTYKLSFLLDPTHYLTFPLLLPIFEMKVGKRNIIYSIVLKGSWCYIIRLSLLQDIHCPITYRKLSPHCNGSLQLLFHLVILTNYIQSQITPLCCKTQPACQLVQYF